MGSIYLLYLFLTCYNAGNMLTLQIQHYSIYSFVGKESFKTYMQANNKAALIPSIIPAMLLLLLSIVMIFYRPVFISLSMSILFLIINILAFFSTFAWQRRLQSEMAKDGYDENKIKLLCSTNWIRTLLFLTQAIMAVLLLPM